MVELDRRTLLETSVAAGLGASVTGLASAGETDSDTDSALMVKGELERFATVAFGAETTGPFVVGNGRPGHEQPGQGTAFFSHQHPADSDRNQEGFKRAGVGYVKGFTFDTRDNGDGFDELSIPTTAEEQGRVRVAEGEYAILAHEKQAINGGSERFGVPQAPDGTPIDAFAGSSYSAAGNMPDMNQFVATPHGEADGFLYTNHETSPGTLTRMPITFDDGAVVPDLANTTNLANYAAYRDLGGTRINCYGDLTPWGTPVSAEEDYAHSRVALGATVGDVVEKGGVGRRGAAAFYNRPNPTAIQDRVGDYYESGWYVQGFFALAGLERQAYYLGAEPVDQDDGTNDPTPLDGPFPNRYRYGHHVEFRNPDAVDPAAVEPVKHHVMGRGAWEAPDVQHDRRTVYMTSDGSFKGIYKFVADRRIPSYDDPMDVAGTLYAPTVTNAAAVTDSPPGEVDLELEWLALGHASNREVESWIAAFDGITQVDYLESHTEDWTAGDPVTAEVLEAADREVVANGNRDYIADEEILEWADQYENRGSDGVDEDLRRVPFLETRAAAKEIGATIEFRKAEGIDSADPVTPGDYVYVGLSEVNDGMTDDDGSLQTKRVDGGIVYRAELESDYDISTLEPVIVGPDATDSAGVSDDVLLNVDNVYVMDDGRVICCEDADQLGRSYPNDCLYVYTPDEERRKESQDDAAR